MWESAANNCDDCSIKLNFWSNQFTIFEVTIPSCQQSKHEFIVDFVYLQINCYNSTEFSCQDGRASTTSLRR